MERICLLLSLWGIILIIVSISMAKSARKVDKRICKDISLSDEEFNKIRNEKVYKPEKLADCLFYIGMALQFPSIILSLYNLL